MKLGIVGLPNVGKSTLFNAITRAGAQAANYPFCTIEPNTGVVPVPDKRLDVLAEMYHPKKVTPATIEFVDIAGLVKGASKGEGLGNKFLSHIREVRRHRACGALLRGRKHHSRGRHGRPGTGHRGHPAGAGAGRSGDRAAPGGKGATGC